MNSLRGQFLVASPHLSDENFFRAVILMIQHDEDGALGLVLNRCTSEPLRNALPDTEESWLAKDALIHNGGPVPGPLMALHRKAKLADVRVIPGVFLSTQKETLAKLFAAQKANPKSFRVFSGYSGWAAGQLEKELTVGGWLIHPATSGDIFYPEDDLWQQLVRKIGLAIIAPTLNEKFVLDDPSVN